MQAHCLRHTEIPGTTELFRDFLYHFDRVAPFYEYNHLQPSSYADAAGKVSFPRERRQALVAALRRQNGPSAQLDRLAQADTLAVVTGQQVGLFSGPCYTIYKALTAVRLAGQLTARGIPAVPVFWLATEDHDFEEISHAWMFDAEMEPQRFEVTAREPDHRPAGGVEVDQFPVAAVRKALSGFPYGEEVAAMVEESYRPGETMGAGFTSLLRRMLAGFDLVYMDPMDPAIRALAAPLLREAVPGAETLGKKLLERNHLLELAGYHAQVHVEEKTSLFFLLEGGHRVTLRREGDVYTSDSGRWSASELAARAEQLSPNALLRPVVQDYLLPTVAQIGGPAELAYLAQSQTIYHELGRPAPVVAPRAGFTLLDARAAKLMARHSLAARDLMNGIEPLRQAISRTLVPAETLRTLAETKEDAGQMLGRLEASLARFDKTLAEATVRSRQKIQHQLSKIESKTMRQALVRDERAAADAAYLHNLVYPNKHLQERIYSFLPFAARYGPDLAHRLGERVRLECPDHILLTL